MILISSLSPTVFSSFQDRKYENEDQSGLPDLISSVELFQIDNQTWYNFSITNIGDAPAEHYNVSLWVYPLGTFLLRNNIMWFLHDIQFPLGKITYLLEEILHITPWFIEGMRMDSPYQLDPGETDIVISWGPFDEMIGDYMNTRLCVILESTADPNNEIEESNELNNRDVIRWWLPIQNEPPKSE